MRLVPRLSGDLAPGDWPALRALLRAAFSGRRKRLAKALAHGLDLAPEVVAAWCAAAQVDPGLRADAVTPPQYRRLVACRPGRAGGQDILTG